MPEFPADIALAYVDCDLYSSTTTVLEFLRKRLKHGMIIAFDDYYLYSPTAAAGERVALIELARAVRDRFLLLPYVQFGFGGMSFIVEDKALSGSGAELMISH
jgi:O-methyltransferase